MVVSQSRNGASWLQVWLVLGSDFRSSSASRDRQGDETNGWPMWGWLETKETTLKKHLLWARISVKGSREKIPTEIEIEDGDATSMVWSSGKIKKKKGEKHSDRYVSGLTYGEVLCRGRLTIEMQEILREGKESFVQKSIIIGVLYRWINVRMWLVKIHLEKGMWNPW